MLQFYYHPLSPLSRRVWITLLEKKLEFEPIIINLDRGEQLKPEFLHLNPFHHVPVILDGDLRIIESLAIMDYLEYKYPQIALLPNNYEYLARVKMVQMVVNNELGSQVIPLIFNEPDSIEVSQAKRHLKRICQFLSKLLADDLYFGGDLLTLGDIVAGNSLILIEKLGFNLERFPSLIAYNQRLMTRKAWQQTQPDKAQITAWKDVVKNIIYKLKNS